MITKISNATDAMNALSENFTMLVTGKRKVVDAKEVNNGVGKMINLAKTQVIEKMRVGDKQPLSWLATDETIDTNAFNRRTKAKRQAAVPIQQIELSLNHAYHISKRIVRLRNSFNASLKTTFQF